VSPEDLARRLRDGDNVSLGFGVARYLTSASAARCNSNRRETGEKDSVASPIGHSIIGLALTEAGNPSAPSRRWWYALALLSVNFADLDFLPGLLIGDINRFHRSITHSLVAALIFGVCVALVARLWRAPAVRAGVLATVLYTTHLLVDFLSGNPSEISGQPLLWPFFRDDVMSPWSPLTGVFHGGPGDGFWEFVQIVFSWQNLETILVEALVFAPLLLLALVLRRVTAARQERWKIEPRRSEPEANL